MTINGSPAAAPGYRDLMSCFPTGVAVVTALDADQQPHGMTCTSLCSVAVAPPTLLVSLHEDSGTHLALRDTGRFALNLLHAGGQRAAEVFSSAAPDRFHRVGWRPSPVLDLPWLTRDAFAFAECRVTRTVPAADHVLVLGEVVSTRQQAEPPLLYGMRQFAAWHQPSGIDGQPGVVVPTGRDAA